MIQRWWPAFAVALGIAIVVFLVYDNLNISPPVGTVWLDTDSTPGRFLVKKWDGEHWRQLRPYDPGDSARNPSNKEIAP